MFFLIPPFLEFKKANELRVLAQKERDKNTTISANNSPGTIQAGRDIIVQHLPRNGLRLLNTSQEADANGLAVTIFEFGSEAATENIDPYKVALSFSEPFENATHYIKALNPHFQAFGGSSAAIDATKSSYTVSGRDLSEAHLIVKIIASHPMQPSNITMEPKSEN
ncbi:hypothetical protein [Verrucomicrobium sp. GAS474]|uniref:hypothetical protein n=1 Tax=Verrucomicrobium sp. GAS474 TaxID=1882831 RepID=UPI0012FF6218|nr:hypothetical protein [Verrucomicrobium sp. GAS474]